jgi:hypothetical protein
MFPWPGWNSFGVRLKLQDGLWHSGCGMRDLGDRPASLPPMQFEFMIESILYARDTWLKGDGIIWPTTAALHLVPCSAEKDYHSKVLFWDNAYEFNLSALK